MGSQKIFISYCWSDGIEFAEELEKQLKDDFNVIRDKSKLGVNDDIEDFMRGIADCDIVILILTEKYTKSDNCMKELTYLVDQPDWKNKAMLLVIDYNLYNLSYEDKIAKYWSKQLKKSTSILVKLQRKSKVRLEEVESRTEICNHLDNFFKELKSKNNPSQIAIVKEVYKMAKRDTHYEKENISLGEKKVLQFIEQYEKMSVDDISSIMGINRATAQRYVMRLINSGKVERIGTRNNSKVIIKNDQYKC